MRILPPPRPARYRLSLCPLGASEIAVRRAGPDDAARIAKLLDAHGRAFGGEPSVNAEEIRHWLGLDAYAFWVASRAGELVAYADADERPGRERYWVDLRSLDGEAAQRLLHAHEEWAAGRAAPGSLVHVAVPDDDAASSAALEAAGYRVVRYDFEMRIDLADAPPEPVWPDGVEIRTFRLGEDDEELWRASNEAFADHWEFVPDPFEHWRSEVLGHPDFDPALFFVPVERDRVAGLAFCLLRDLGGPVGWVQILGVRREWRRRGLGLALLHHSFSELRTRGATWAGLEVDAENLTGAVRLYERAGMRQAKRLAFWARELNPAQRPGESRRPPRDS